MQPLLHTKNSNSSKSSSGNSCSSSCNDTLVTAHHQQCLLTVHASWSPPEQVNEQGTPSQPMTYFFHRAAAAIILAGQCQGQTLADKRNTFHAPPSDVLLHGVCRDQTTKQTQFYQWCNGSGQTLIPREKQEKTHVFAQSDIPNRGSNRCGRRPPQPAQRRTFAAAVAPPVRVTT